MKGAARKVRKLAAKLLYRAVGGPGVGGGAEDFGEMLRRNAPAIITLLIILVLGALILSIMSGMSYYILGVLNQSGVSIPANVNFMSSVVNTMPGVISMLMVAVIIAVVVFIIIMLVRSAGVVQTWAGGF